MAIATAKADALAHIEDGQLDAHALEQFCNSFSVGPVKINYCVDLSVPQITVDVSLAGVRIGGGVINAQNPSITIGGGAAGFKAEVTLTADFGAKQIKYDITVCVPILGCTSYDGVLFSW